MDVIWLLFNAQHLASFRSMDATEICRACFNCYYQLPKHGKPQEGREWTLLAGFVLESRLIPSPLQSRTLTLQVKCKDGFCLNVGTSFTNWRSMWTCAQKCGGGGLRVGEAWGSGKGVRRGNLMELYMSCDKIKSCRWLQFLDFGYDQIWCKGIKRIYYSA